MLKIKIKSKIHGEKWLTKETAEEVEAYKQWALESQHWGSPARWVHASEVQDPTGLESKKVIDVAAQPEKVVQVQEEIDGQVIIKDQVIPAVEEVSHLEYLLPAEYTIEIEDITAQVEQEKAQLQAVQQAQYQAGIRLQQFPAQVDACQDLESLKVAIKQMVQDIAVLLK